MILDANPFYQVEEGVVVIFVWCCMQLLGTTLEIRYLIGLAFLFCGLFP